MRICNWNWNQWIAVLALSSLVCVPLLRADDDDVKGEQRRFTVKLATAAGKHWLGIHAVPVDDALKSQLGITNRLIVHHVIPDSPAAKAGLQTHDILLKFGDKDILNLEELVKAVNDWGTKDGQLVVMRGGKEKSLTIKPTDRPTDEQFHALLPRLDPDEIHKLLGKLGADGTFTWHAVGPGILSEKLRLDSKVGQFPNGLSIAVSRENDQPAKIIAKKDGQTYETTQDRLDVLPEDIRPFVERMLSGAKGLMLEKMLKDAPHKLPKAALEELKKADLEAGKAALRHHIEIRKADDGQFQELQKAIEALRREVEQLKDAKKRD